MRLGSDNKASTTIFPRRADSCSKCICYGRVSDLFEYLLDILSRKDIGMERGYIVPTKDRCELFGPHLVQPQNALIPSHAGEPLVKSSPGALYPSLPILKQERA